VSSSISHDPAGSGLAGDVTEPLAAVGDPGRVLPGQIARFGELVGRELSARAFAALQARGARNPQPHRNPGDQPLTAAEQREMAALRASITYDLPPVAVAGAASTPRSEPPQSLPRPVRLRRRLAVTPRGLAGRHHRAAGPALS
jgi:hypothetical protein